MSLFGKIKSDELLWHTGILFSGMMVVHVCNFVFQMAIGRALPNEEYALFAAFLGLLSIVSRPLSTLSTGISHYSSLLCQEGRRGDAGRLVKRWLWFTGVPSVLLGGLVILFNGPLVTFFHLDRVAPVLIAGAVLPALFLLPVLNGAGQGFQLFGWCSAASISGAVVRLGLGAGLVWFVVPACGWAMLGHGASVYVSVAVLLLGLWWVLRGQIKGDATLPRLRFYLIQSFFIQAAYAVLMTADVVMMKHYVPTDTEFAYAATLGRMIVFLPGVIVVAMFPKVASRGTATKKQYRIFLRSFGYTALFVTVAVVGCAVFSGLLARILFGIVEASVHLKRMIGLMALVMGFSALLNVVIQFLVAQRRFKAAFPIIGFAGLYLAGVAVFHATSWQVVMVAAFCNAGALGLAILLSRTGAADDS